MFGKIGKKIKKGAKKVKKGIDKYIFDEKDNKQANKAAKGAANAKKEMYGDTNQATQDAIAETLRGGVGQVDMADFKARYSDPLAAQFKEVTDPAIRKSFGGNYWSTARQKAQQKGAESVQSEMNKGLQAMQDAASQKKLAGLGLLQGAQEAVTNARLGAANAPKGNSGLQNLANISEAGGKIASLAALAV